MLPGNKVLSFLEFRVLTQQLKVLILRGTYDYTGNLKIKKTKKLINIVNLIISSKKLHVWTF